MTSGYDFGSGKIIYNKFKSVVSYAQSDLPLFSKKAIEVMYINVMLNNYHFLSGINPVFCQGLPSYLTYSTLHGLQHPRWLDQC